MEDDTFSLAAWRSYTPIGDAAILASVLFFLFGPIGAAVFLPFLVLVPLPLFFVIGRAVANQRRRPGAVAITRDGIEISSGARVHAIPRASLASGMRTGRSSLTLSGTDGRNHELRFAPDRDPDAAVDVVLHHLGFGPKASTPSRTFPLRSSFGPVGASALAFAGAFVAGLFVADILLARVETDHKGAYVFAFSLAVAVAAAYLAGRNAVGHLIIGSDVLVHVAGWKKKRIAYDAFATVAVDLRWKVIRLVRRDGRDARELPMVGMPDALLDAVAERVRHAQREHERRSGATRDFGALFARGRRPVDEWRAQIRGQAQGAGGFREAMLPKEQIARLLGDPGAPADQRVGAALALRDLGAPDARMSIRIAAEASAAPELRRALEAAAGDEIDDAEIERALKGTTA